MTLLQRDVRTLAELEKIHLLPQLLKTLAAQAGSLLNDASISRTLGLNAMTCKNYRMILNKLLLTFELQPWFRNIGKRLSKSPKIYLIDTLLLVHLLGYDLASLPLKRPDLFGHVLENFVATELLKQISFANTRESLMSFRTSDNKEVDFLLERPNGDLVGIEVKAASQVSVSDFSGLKELRKLSEKSFICGIVLYSGETFIPFDTNLFALPIDWLWS